MKRYKHGLSNYKLTTCKGGELVPIGIVEVLPGDTVQQHTALLLRASPLVAPVMHPVSVRVHHWFVPYRLLWDGWEDFITGGSDGLGGASGAFPYIDAGGSGFSAGGLADYLGIPPSVANLQVSALPFRAYGKIWNEYYRDQDLDTALTVSTASGADSSTNTTLQKCAWEKDYFTSARPWMQKGPDVTLPLGTSAPIHVPNGVGADLGYYDDAVAGDRKFSSSGTYLQGSTATAPSSNLYADLSAATAVSVNTVREAFALQRMMEARALFGSRYTEYLRYLGIRSSDSRLQRPEYLGGGKQIISFSEVVQTGGNNSTLGKADMLGHGIAAMRSRRYRRFFEEHGVIVSLLSIRPRAMYANALNRLWSRRVKEDFWTKELEQIGQQEVYRREVYAQADSGGAGGDTVFGYANRYAEYRHVPSEVTGDFRSPLMYHWHMARILGSAPTLNSAFIKCDPPVRCFADQTNDQFWIMANHSIQARRLVAPRSIGRIL